MLPVMKMRTRRGVRISRRGFLLGSAGIAAVCGSAAPALASSGQSIVERFVRQNCPTEAISDAEITDFAAAFLQRSSLAGHRRRTVLFLLENRWAHSVVPRWVREAQERQERHLITRFMLSTDAFDADRERGAARYWGYADPYNSGCANPVARFETRTPAVF